MCAVAGLIALMTIPGESIGEVSISYLANNNCFVENISGKGRRLATQAEYQSYLRQDQIPPAMPDRSPGGRYQISYRDEFGRNDIGIADSSGKRIPAYDLPLPKLNFSATPSPRFVAWGPTEGTVVIERVSNVKTGTYWTEPFVRSIYSLETKKALPFAGWWSPSRRIGISTPGMGFVYDAAKSYPGSDSDGVAQNYYVVALPSSLADYDFRSARKTQLTSRGVPFHARLPRSFRQTEIRMKRCEPVEFSVDERWAIMDGQFLVDVASGTVRKLGGTEAHFVNSSAPISEKPAVPKLPEATNVKPVINGKATFLDTKLGASSRMVTAWSRQGQRLAVSNGGREVRIFDAARWTMFSIEVTGPVQKLKFSATGKTLGVLFDSDKNHLALVDVPEKIERSKTMQTIYVSDRNRAKINSPIEAFAIDSGGGIVIIALENGKVERWATMVGARIGGWETGGRVRDLEFSNDPDVFYAMLSDGRIQEWSTKTWNLKTTRSLGQGVNVESAVLLADESQVGIFSNREARLTDFSKGAPTSISLPSGTASRQFTLDGKKLLYVIGSKLLVSSVVNGKILSSYTAPTSILSLSVSEDGTVAAIGLSNGKLALVKI